MVEFVQCGVMDLLLTGVDVTNVDESTYEIFAPNKDAMVEAKEFIDQIKNVQVSHPNVHHFGKEQLCVQ